MICKVIEGEEEISCPPCHEWNTCKTQQRHNHFHFLHKVFSEDCKCIFSTCTLVSPHICDICQQHLKRNTFQQQESNLCRFKILVKVCCSFQKPSTLLNTKRPVITELLSVCDAFLFLCTLFFSFYLCPVVWLNVQQRTATRHTGSVPGALVQVHVQGISATFFWIFVDYDK